MRLRLRPRGARARVRFGFAGASSASGSAASSSAALRAASSAAFASSSARRVCLGVELGGDLRVVLGAQVDLVAGRLGGAVGVRFQTVLALERVDLLDGDLQLVRDPGVGASLSHPPADLVKLRTQRPAAHEQAGRLAKTCRVSAGW